MRALEFTSFIVSDTTAPTQHELLVLIEGVASDYEINHLDPFSTNFKFSRWGLRAAAPRNISLLSGKKRKVIKTRGISVTASVEHDVTDKMARAMGGDPADMRDPSEV